jgi:hypothetical protein
MALIELVAATELILFSCSRAKANRARKQRVLMGSGLGSLCLPIIDEYLKRKTAGASRAEIFVASQLARVCRRAVQTRSFQSLLLHGIRSVVKRRSKRLISPWRITQ